MRTITFSKPICAVLIEIEKSRGSGPDGTPGLTGRHLDLLHNQDVQWVETMNVTEDF